MSDCPECYGNLQKTGKLPACASCEFVESCKYYAETESSCNSNSGHVSYERYSYSKEVASHDDVVECDDEPVEDNAVLQVMEFLLDVDNYTAELLSAVLHEGCYNTVTLAKKFGVSRQAIHRKIIDCCHLHPELRKLFITRMTRCRRILSDSDRLTKQQKKNSNPNQMEFDF